MRKGKEEGAEKEGLVGKGRKLEGKERKLEGKEYNEKAKLIRNRSRINGTGQTRRQ